MAVSSSSQFSIQPQQASSLIYIRGLHKTYLRGQERVEALRGVDLEVEQGEFLVIMGPSGGGKSTLLHLIGGIDRPTSGTLQVAGTALETVSEDRLTHFRRSHIGFIFQFYNLLPSINALENTALPLLARGIRRGEALKTAAQLLELVGLKDRLKHKPAQLSGGEQQRVAIARAVAGKPELVLADEPTGDLDGENTESILSLMQEFNQRFGITFVVATHNQRIAAAAGCSLELRSGRLSSRPSIL
jgi:putative ABC transport system ATP-binding protein